MTKISIRRVAGLRPHHLLKDQDVSRLEVRESAEQRGFSSSLRQAAVVVAPCVELHQVVFGKQVRILHGPKDDNAGPQSGLFVTRTHLQVCRHSRREGVETCNGMVQKNWRGNLEVYPGTGIASIVDVIVDQQGVAAQ